MHRETQEKPVYAVVASVQLPHVSDLEFEASLAELCELAKTLGYTIVHTFSQKRTAFDTTGYLGIGKRQEIAHYIEYETRDEIEVETLTLRHEPAPGPQAGEVAGHLHPCVTVGGRGRDHLRRPCFHLGPQVGVLPAFGEFTGMHPVRPAAGDLLGVVGEDRVLALGA